MEMVDVNSWLDSLVERDLDSSFWRIVSNFFSPKNGTVNYYYTAYSRDILVCDSITVSSDLPRDELILQIKDMYLGEDFYKITLEIFE
jgi:hypothetical protein